MLSACIALGLTTNWTASPASKCHYYLRGQITGAVLVNELLAYAVLSFTCYHVHPCDSGETKLLGEPKIYKQRSPTAWRYGSNISSNGVDVIQQVFVLGIIVDATSCSQDKKFLSMLQRQ